MIDKRCQADGTSSTGHDSSSPASKCSHAVGCALNSHANVVQHQAAAAAVVDQVTANDAAAAIDSCVCATGCGASIAA